MWSLARGRAWSGFPWSRNGCAESRALGCVRWKESLCTTVFPAIWFSLEMHDGQDVNFYCRVLIDNSKRESMKEKTTGAVRVDWPGLWCVLNPRDSELNFLKECFASSFSLLVIPVLCLFKFSEGLIMEDDGKVSSHELSGV